MRLRDDLIDAMRDSVKGWIGIKLKQQEKEMSEFDIKVGDKFQAEVTDSIKGLGIKIGPFHFDETCIPDFLKHFKKIETTSKEFDLKVGDKVRLRNGQIATINEVDTCARYYPYQTLCEDGNTFWHFRDGKMNIHCNYDIVEKIEEKTYSHEEAWKEPPKLHKKLEKKIRFSDEEPNLDDRSGSTADILFGIDCVALQDYDSADVKREWPRTATVKIEIIED